MVAGEGLHIKKPAAGWACPARMCGYPEEALETHDDICCMIFDSKDHPAVRK
jgi:hypothetical protein